MKRVVICTFVSCACATIVSAQTVDVLDFESIDPGCVVDSIHGAGGTGPVLVNGVNPTLAGNLAVIFDSSAPTGGDVDLGTPNETCTVAGPGEGIAGEMGMPFENCIAKGNLLIVDENGGAAADGTCPSGFAIADPDDADVVGASLNFDFSALGSVVIDSITILDTEPDEEDPAVVTLFDGAMVEITTESLPTPGDNGVAQVSLGDIPGVVFMNVTLNGSGAIDDIVYCMCDDGDECTTDTCLDGECINTPKDCGDDDACTIDSCNRETGECINAPINCDDQNGCTSEFCLEGECVIEPISCDDMDDCTVDSCVDGQCVNEAIDCDDEDACTADECVDGECENTPIDCDDEDPCTDDSCDDGECINEDNGECGLECRVTGGGNSEFDGHEYTFGGQAGAPTASQPQPFGEWTHHERKGPGNQKFIFHAGTASAPDETEIDLVVCSDPGWCMQARPAPAKQIDFEGVGTFKNLHNASDDLDGVIAKETLHWFEVHIEDLGEPGSASDRHGNALRSRGAGQRGRDGDRHVFGGQDPAEGCSPDGHAGEIAPCDCPDFYRITIYEGVMPGEALNKTDVIYEVYNYFNGNLQIHPPVGG